MMTLSFFSLHFPLRSMIFIFSLFIYFIMYIFFIQNFKVHCQTQMLTDRCPINILLKINTSNFLSFFIQICWIVFKGNDFCGYYQLFIKSKDFLPLFFLSIPLPLKFMSLNNIIWFLLFCDFLKGIFSTLKSISLYSFTEYQKGFQWGIWGSKLFFK